MGGFWYFKMNPLKVSLLSFGSVAIVALLCWLLSDREGPESVQPTAMSAEHPFFACAACHGFEGEGNELLLAPRLAGQRPEYLRLQVQSFQKEWRGLDANGQLMVEAIRPLTQETIDAAITYVSELPSGQIEPSQLSGDIRHGAYQYKRSCEVCHGATGDGSQIEAEVPRLDIQDAWYLERQLTQYRDQQRGIHPDDALGNVMRFYAELLPNEQAVRDVALWLNQASAEPTALSAGPRSD